MAGDDNDRSLESAMERLPMAVFTVEGGRVLRAMNRRATDIFDAEELTWDVLSRRPDHPLSMFVDSLLRSTSNCEVRSRLVEFPGGARYRIEPSRKSEKGPTRTLVLLVERASETRACERLFDRWCFTPREREVALGLMRGESSPELCERIGIAASTIKTHLGNILTKSGARSRAEFLALLLQRDEEAEKE